jgi:hypothetical protein
MRIEIVEIIGRLIDATYKVFAFMGFVDIFVPSKRNFIVILPRN